MLYIFNTTIAPTAGLTYHTKTITPTQARRVLENAREQSLHEGSCFGWYTSAVGHDATAQIATEVLGVPVSVNRIAAAMRTGDSAICVKLRGRAPEGVILTTEQMEVIGYDLVLMHAVDQSAVAMECHRWTDPECDNIHPDAPPLEVCAGYLVERVRRETASHSEELLKRGISYNGSDPVGPIMTRLVSFATRTIMEHFASVRQGLTEFPDPARARALLESAVSRLVDALNDRAIDSLTY